MIRHSLSFFFSLFIVLISFTACSKESFPSYKNDIPQNEGIRIALKRAEQLSLIRWTPVGNIPNNHGWYSEGEEVVGLPYSSVKELDKFIGLDVSFETFMTAVHNPRSILYKENVGHNPYCGSNCASYYGVVCSSVVNYCLGLPANYTTSCLDTLSLFEKVGIQNPGSIELCDVLWSTGHEVMIYDIIRYADNSIKTVTLLESSGIRTALREYGFGEFCQRWVNDGWINYRYKYTNEISGYKPIPYVNIANENPPAYDYNDIIALYRGNKSVFREGEDVLVNVLDSSYTTITLYEGNHIIDNRITSSFNETYQNLSYGSYYIVATDSKGNRSHTVSFEVVDTEVKVIPNGAQSLRVNFDSRYGQPMYVVFCNKNGSKLLLRVLTEQEKESKAVYIHYDTDLGPCFCKVYFSTPNGTVTNSPIPILL